MDELQQWLREARAALREPAAAADGRPWRELAAQLEARRAALAGVERQVRAYREAGRAPAAARLQQQLVALQVRIDK